MTFSFQLNDYPTEPGVYLMKDARGRILYVGKAKNLRKRLASYFRAGAAHSPRIAVMVSKVARVDTLVTTTEKEALLTEESLIKKHRPRYNVVLRDDKQYILFKLAKGHAFPRLTLTRKVSRDGSVYFGPFTSAAGARETWKIIGRVFPLRKCSDHVFANRVRPCLYHHIRQCLAPCVLEVDRDAYTALVQRVEMLLAGRSSELARLLEKEMSTAAERLEFERAAVLRDQLAALKKTVERQTVVLGDGRNGPDMDVLDVATLSKGLAVGVLFVRQGRLLGQKSFAFAGLGLEDAPEVVAGVLTQFYTASKAIPPRILTPWPPEDVTVGQVLAERRGGGVNIIEPHATDEKQLCELARRNARDAQPLVENVSLGDALRTRLRLAVAPERIECVDVSHLGGQGVRVGQVVFQDGTPLKDAYRVYAVPEAEGTSDDYLALAKWAKRRLAAGEPWPDLVLVDGGKGQLSAVQRVLDEEGAGGLFELASIAKAGRSGGEMNDEIYRPGRKNPLPLKPGSPELLFLQRVRDAAHDFVIGRQRRARAKQVLSSELLRLPGIGPKTARLLWDRFPSVEAMAVASLEEITAIPGLGSKRAAKIQAALSQLKRK